MHTRFLLTAALLMGSASAFAHDATTVADPLAHTKAPQNARIFIISPKNGATVGPDVTVQFGVSGITIEPAGMTRPNSGHHHLLIDTRELPPVGAPIPSDARHKHYGKGQTQDTDPSATRHPYTATYSWQWLSHAV